MPQNENPEAQNDEAETATQRDTDYVPSVVACVPEGVTLETLNEQNSKYWNNK